MVNSSLNFFISYIFGIYKLKNIKIINSSNIYSCYDLSGTILDIKLKKKSCTISIVKKIQKVIICFNKP